MKALFVNVVSVKKGIFVTRVHGKMTYEGKDPSSGYELHGWLDSMYKNGWRVRAMTAFGKYLRIVLEKAGEPESRRKARPKG